MNFKPIAQLELPPFNMANMTNYFITCITCDGKSANDFKHLNTKAYPLFKDGHVQNIVVYEADNFVYVRAACLPEMRKDDTYKIDISLCKSGDIVSATCGCPAGCGPKGSCKHIAALCYALEEFSRIKKTKDFVACTSKLQTWNHPRKRISRPSIRR